MAEEPNIESLLKAIISPFDSEEYSYNTECIWYNILQKHQRDFSRNPTKTNRDVRTLIFEQYVASGEFLEFEIDLWVLSELAKDMSRLKRYDQAIEYAQKARDMMLDAHTEYCCGVSLRELNQFEDNLKIYQKEAEQAKDD